MCITNEDSNIIKVHNTSIAIFIFMSDILSPYMSNEGVSVLLSIILYE